MIGVVPDDVWLPSIYIDALDGFDVIYALPANVTRGNVFFIPSVMLNVPVASVYPVRTNLYEWDPTDRFVIVPGVFVPVFAPSIHILELDGVEVKDALPNAVLPANVTGTLMVWPAVAVNEPEISVCPSRVNL